MKDIEIQRIEDFIKRLNEKDLVYINRLVVERLKLLSQQRSTTQMQQFNIGEKVSFFDNNGTQKKGKIQKLNKKTISVITDDNQRWNVGPGLLKHEE